MIRSSAGPTSRWRGRVSTGHRRWRWKRVCRRRSPISKRWYEPVPVDLKPADLGAQDRHVVRGGETGHHGQAAEPDIARCRGQDVAQPRRLVGGFGGAQSGEQLLGLVEETVEQLLEGRAAQGVMDFSMTSA